MVPTNPAQQPGPGGIGFLSQASVRSNTKAISAGGHGDTVAVLFQPIGPGSVPAPGGDGGSTEQGGARDDWKPDPAAPAGTHRQLFETRLHPLPDDARAALASSAGEPELSALCFDPTPSVVRAVLSSPRAGLPHARLIAAHHGNAVGLDALGEKPEILHDAEVQRLLLRNQQTSMPLLQRILSRRRLAEVYNATQSRELPERNRTHAMQMLRRRFSEVSAEERVELILRTEGRALPALAGLSLDGKSAALLCARTFTSALIVENLARWPATPPPVILHLLRQPLLRQMPALRAMLKRHPNCPQSAR